MSSIRSASGDDVTPLRLECYKSLHRKPVGNHAARWSCCSSELLLTVQTAIRHLTFAKTSGRKAASFWRTEEVLHQWASELGCARGDMPKWRARWKCGSTLKQYNSISSSNKNRNRKTSPAVLFKISRRHTIRFHSQAPAYYRPPALVIEQCPMIIPQGMILIISVRN